MDDNAISRARSQLSSAGLTHEVFDAQEVAADLAERTTLSESLDEMVTASELVPGSALPAVRPPG